jgi:hypothetical protein
MDKKVDQNKLLEYKDEEPPFNNKIYEATLNILNIMSNAALKEAEKVSCQNGCKGAQKVYIDTIEKMLKPVNEILGDKSP